MWGGRGGLLRKKDRYEKLGTHAYQKHKIRKKKS
jgi:hypothetical protein